MRGESRTLSSIFLLMGLLFGANQSLALDDPCDYVGDSCNVYHDLYVSTRGGTCKGSGTGYCSATLQDCRGKCLSNYAFSSGSGSPDGASCTTSGGSAGTCSCGSGSFTSATCNASPPSGGSLVHCGKGTAVTDTKCDDAPACTTAAGCSNNTMQSPAIECSPSEACTFVSASNWRCKANAACTTSGGVVCGTSTGTINEGMNCDDGASACTTITGNIGKCKEGLACTCNAFPKIGATCKANASCTTSGGGGGGGLKKLAKLSFSPDGGDLGSVKPGLTKSTSLTVSNSSTNDAGNCDFSLSDSTNFAISGSCGIIDGKGSCSVNLIAQPKSVGTHSTTVTVSCAGGSLAAREKFNVDVFFANLVSESKQKLWHGIYRAHRALVPSVGACSSQTSPATCPLDCPGGGSSYTGTVDTSCCCSSYSDCGYTSQNACICGNFPNSTNCKSGGGGGGGGPALGDYAAGAKTSLAFSVTATANPTLTISPVSHDFGNVTLGSTSTVQNFRVSNSGGAAQICKPTLSGANASDFTGPTNCLTSPNCDIATGGYLDFSISASPSTSTTTGTKTATLSIECTGSGSGTVSTNANGIVYAAATPVPPPVPVAAWSGSVLDLGDVMYGAFPSTTWNVRFSNTGTGEAATCNYGLSNSTDFEMVSNSCSASSTIASGASCDFVVRINPTAPTADFSNTGPARSTSINIACTDTDPNKKMNTSFSSLSFKAWSPPSLSFSPANKHLPDTMITKTSTPPDNITVTNNGGWGAASCTVTPGNTTDFTWTGMSGCSSIARGGNCTLQVVAKPTTVTNNINSTLSISCTAAINGVGTYTTAATSPFYWYNGLPLQCPGGQYDAGGSTHFCQCPKGYEWISGAGTSGECRPSLPSNEFFRVAGGLSDHFPVCGTGRLPVSSNFNTLDIATNGVPRSSQRYHYAYASPTPTTPGFNFKYAQEYDTTGTEIPAPNYIYKTTNLNHCACSTGTFPITTASPVPGTFLSETITTGVTSGAPRFPSDNYDVITSVTAASPTSTPYYGPVAIAKDNVSNGYLGSVWSLGTTAAECGCPNVNEQVSSALMDPGFPSGNSCSTRLDMSDTTTQQFAMLTKFNPAAHASAVINNSSEVHDGGGTAASNIVRTIMLPVASGGYQKYERRIWTCAPPTELNTSTRRCVWTAAKHQCDDGTGGGPVSPLSPNINPQTATDFARTVNKKLACCMNAFNRGTPNAALKYDCIDNSTTTYPTFDSLWRSNDATGNGGQNNGLVLTNSSGQPITGFYTLGGQRCTQFSEFGGAIRDAKVTTNTGTGAAISFTYENYNQTATNPLRAAFSSNLPGRGIPTTAAQMRQCPILVRAAMIAKCPAVPSGTSASTTVQQSYDDSGTIRCLAAESVKIQMRVEQIYEIQGMPKMKTIDSVLDSKQAADVSVTDLITSKTVGICPNGATLQPDGTCAF